MRHFIVFTVILFILGCATKSNPLTAEVPHGQFEIYLLKDSLLTGYQASQLDINQLVLRDSPWLTDKGLALYDFSSHSLYLKDGKSEYFDGYNPDSLLSLLPHARAFVVVANGERCYVGSFHSAILSSIPWGPYVDELSVWFYPSDVFSITRSWRDTNDVRCDVRVEEALKSVGIYHGGILLQLQSVSVVENSDTATVDYTYTVTNSDSEVLYVLDPDKMGTTSFHYFTNGVVFRGDNQLIQSMYKVTSSPSVEWDPELYVRVPVGASIQRTVRLKGYPTIPGGTYRCSFEFANPREIEKEHRLISDGRIWLGRVGSNQIEVVVP